ncbi:DNA polymerase III, subunit gamma and tau [Candidatus Peregrinibacteria bacterium CG10_big_fil_rev_8_21_14_0_10_42_8]|nr:MAG: DNA polymerase III, subunit gamma and tau [Candidatus Peregrinibacteria bacterium CG10_big_fil_rev_8_21_14_0_10_42_8]
MYRVVTDKNSFKNNYYISVNETELYCYNRSPMSLYNKYRPKVFTDVQGQEHVVATLEKSAASGKLAHAYLFAGSRGIGKTTIARLLAKELMTRGIEDTNLKKAIQKGVDDGNIVDLLEIDAASNRGIDDIRELIEKVQYSPVIASAKVYIVDEVHMLTKEAFNALLKTLEEPPEFVFFILATTELNKIPTTIQSRCQCFPFRHIREEDIIRRLQYIADQEHITIDREALRAIATASEGGMRDAISLLDQMQSLDSIGIEDVKKRTGGTGAEYSAHALEAITANDKNAILQSIAKIEDAGVPLDVFLRHLLKSTRNALHESIAKNEATTRNLRMLDVLLKAIRDMRTSPVPGLVVEAALLTLCTDDGTSIPAPVAKEPEPVKEVVTETKEKPVTKEVETHPSIINAPEVSIESIRQSWTSVINDATPSSVKMSLKNGRVTEFENNTITICFSSAFHRDKVRGVDASRTVEGLFEKIFKQKIVIHCTLEEDARTAAAMPVSEPKQEMVNMADAAAEIF